MSHNMPGEQQQLLQLPLLPLASASHIRRAIEEARLCRRSAEATFPFPFCSRVDA